MIHLHVCGKLTAYRIRIYSRSGISAATQRETGSLATYRKFVRLRRCKHRKEVGFRERLVQ